MHVKIVIKNIQPLASKPPNVADRTRVNLKASAISYEDHDWCLFRSREFQHLPRSIGLHLSCVPVGSKAERLLARHPESLQNTKEPVRILQLAPRLMES